MASTTEQLVVWDNRQQISFRVGRQRLFGMLHLPLTGLPAPAVVVCHGLAGDKNGRYRFYVLLAQRLAQMGIGCLRFDYRGCGDSEGLFSQVTVASQLADAVAATEWIQEHPSIDGKRLAVLGRSFGGLVAILTARKTRAFRSICLWSAVFDGGPWRHLWDKVADGSLTPEQCDAALNFNGQQASLALFRELFDVDMPQELAALCDIPMLHIHGAKDPKVDISHADHYKECREGSVAPSHFIRLPEGDHEISNIHEREEALEATLEWFRQTL